MTTPDLKGVAVIVEDEWLIRMELAEALAADGWTIVEVGSGEAALALLSAKHEVDLLLTDIRLSGAVSGWDVAEAFRAQLPALPVIYASGNAALPTRQVHDSVFLGKPVRTGELIAVAARSARQKR